MGSFSNSGGVFILVYMDLILGRCDKNEWFVHLKQNNSDSSIEALILFQR